MQKESRVSGLYNLESDDQLTHMGSALGAFTEEYRPDSDDEAGIDPSIVEQVHFGGGDDEPQHRSTKEVYEEIIAKSKLARVSSAVIVLLVRCE